MIDLATHDESKKTKRSFSTNPDTLEKACQRQAIWVENENFFNIYRSRGAVYVVDIKLKF